MGFRREWLPVVALAAMVVGLACGGLGTDSIPGEGPGVSSKADKKKLRVGKSNLKKSKKRRKRPSADAAGKHHKKDEYVVKLRPGVSSLKFPNGKSIKSNNSKLDATFGGLSLSHAAPVHSRHRAKNKKLADILGFDRTLHIRTKKPMEQVLKKLEAHPDVEWVEPVVKAKTLGAPNDPYFEYQWHMQNLDVTKAWETTKGKGVVVAVVDTGVSVGEDGFFKILQGYDFVEDDKEPRDGQGHGTHVAGTIGQKSNNGIGVAGVAPEVTILPVRVLGSDGSGSMTGVASGIIWAVDNGANIINLSLGSSAASEVVADACSYAYEHGVTVVAATGNDGFSDFIGYPAAYDTTIAIGSVGKTNDIAYYSNQGKEIDLVGPGGDQSTGEYDGVVQETIMGGTWGYTFLQGTSMATPHVAGVAALLYARGVHEPDEIRRILRESSDDLGAGGWDTTFGSGVVNPVAALKMAGGKKRPANTSSRGLEISRARVKRIGNNRAVIQWMTTVPSSTLVRGGGEKISEKHPTRSHRVTVEGRPGQTVKFDIASSAKGKTAKDTVKVRF